eukprot:3584603-Rhodomonas_salina.1
MSGTDAASATTRRCSVRYTLLSSYGFARAIVLRIPYGFARQCSELSVVRTCSVMSNTRVRDAAAIVLCARYAMSDIRRSLGTNGAEIAVPGR